MARIAPAGAFQGAVRVGSRLPAHATVLGRALLQDMDADQLRQIFGGSELPQFSEKTPRSVDQLLQLLAQDRQRGHAMGEGFYEAGVSSIAVPVRDAQGRIVAGLGMAVAFTDMAPGRMAECAQQVCAAAGELAGHLRTQHPGFLR